jgi:predicted small lipoprotein YifL
MRMVLLLLTTTSLAACGGSGPTTVGSNAVGAAAATPTAPTSAHSFVTPTTTKTYQSQAAAQKYNYDYTERVTYDKKPILELRLGPVRDAAGNPTFDALGNPITAVQLLPKLDAAGNPTYGAIDEATRNLQLTAQAGQLYTAEARTVRNPGVTVTYDPRNAQFSLVINQNGMTDNISFQDPAHRTDFLGATTPQYGTPNLNPTGDRTKGIQYLQVDSGSSATVYDVSTFFYELPGTTTKYVTYAGFLRNHYEKALTTVIQDYTASQLVDEKVLTKLERAAFVYGEQTANASVPKIGTATFNGNMVASMVNNPSFDTNPLQGTFFQWINGTAKVDVNFATGVVGTTLTGLARAPMFDYRPIKPITNTGFVFDGVAIAEGSVFNAIGSATIDLINAGGFLGNFSSASFANAGVTTNLAIVGSSLDGAFYGPIGQEVGASFRIVGGIPDQRVDIVGSFTGK